MLGKTLRYSVRSESLGLVWNTCIRKVIQRGTHGHCQTSVNILHVYACNVLMNS